MNSPPVLHGEDGPVHSEKPIRFPPSKPPQSGRIPVQTYHVAPGTVAAQGGAYHRSINDILETRFRTNVISSTLSTFFLGPVHIAFGEATPRISRRTEALLRRDKFDCIAIQMIEHGRALGHSSGKSWVSDPGTIMFLDFAQTFVVTDEEHRSYINIMVPRALLAAAGADPAGLHGLLLAQDKSALLGGFIRGLVAGVATLEDADAPALSQMLMDLVGMALRAHPAPNRSASEGWVLEEAERLIALRLGAVDLTPEWIATRLGVSRSELYAVFKHHGGVARWIWQKRLAACHNALQDPADGRSIGALADVHGFGSPAHFSRMYKSAYGVSPSGERRRTHDGSDR